MSFNADQAQFSCTLNRAHKLAERVRQMMADEAGKARIAFSPVSIQAYTGPHQVRAITEQGVRGEVALARHAVLNATLQSLRTAIGRANVEAGIHDLLAEQDSLNRRLQVLRTLLDCRPMMAIDPMEVACYQPLTKADGSRPVLTVSVASLSAETLVSVQDEVGTIEKTLYVLADRIAERNLTKITVSIDAQLAQDIGLV